MIEILIIPVIVSEKPLSIAQTAKANVGIPCTSEMMILTLRLRNVFFVNFCSLWVATGINTTQMLFKVYSLLSL